MVFSRCFQGVSAIFRVFSGCFQGVFPYALSGYALWALPNLHLSLEKCLLSAPNPEN